MYKYRWVNNGGNFKSFYVAVTFVLLLACFWNMGFHCVAIKEFIKISSLLCRSPLSAAAICLCFRLIIISCGSPSPPPYLPWLSFPFPPACLCSDSILCSRIYDNCHYSLLGEENSQRWFSAFPFPLKTLVRPLMCCQKLPECFSTAKAPSVWSRTLVSELRFERQGGLLAFSASPTFQAIFCDVRQLLGLSLPYHTFLFPEGQNLFPELCSLSLWFWIKPSLYTSSHNFSFLLILLP